MSAGLTADLFVSVDGWAGSQDLPGYFGYDGPQLAEWIATELAAPQIMVIGRRTYEVLRGVPADAPDPSWARTLALPKIVFSRTLGTTAWPNTQVCAREVTDEIRERRAGGDTALRTMGSLSIVRQLLAAGLVDRLRLMIFPLLAGPSGREAAFADVAAAELELVDHRVLDGRILLTEYRPTGQDVPRR